MNCDRYTFPDGTVAITCGGDSTDYLIEVGGKTYRFDFHNYMGPLPINADGSVRKVGIKNLFWTAVSLWSQQGKRMNGKWCVWEQEPDPLKDFIRISKKQYVHKSIAKRMGLID